MLSKRAQASDAIVWIVATLIIVVILIVFIFISNLMAKANGIKNFATSSAGSKNYNILNLKTNLAFEINGDKEGEINSWIQNVEIKKS